MATVNNNTTRIHDVEGTLTLNNLPSGGPAASANTDIFLQASQSAGKRLSNVTLSGYLNQDGADNDVSASGTHVGLWMWVTHYVNLSALRVILATGTGSPTLWDGHNFTIGEIPALGGWIRCWVDVGRTADATGSGGGLTKTQLRQVGFQVTLPTVGGNAPNVILDSHDYIAGAALSLTGTSGLWSDFSTADENTTNQYGVFRRRGGVNNCWARVQLGTSGSSLVFTDSNFVIVFVQQDLVNANFMGIDVDLQNASTNIQWTNGVIRSQGTKRGDLVFVGTSGVFTGSAMTLAALRIITLTSACSLTGSLIAGCGQITGAGATLTNNTLNGYEGTTDSSYIVWNVATDPNTKLDNCKFTKGTAATHAIEFGLNSPTTMTLNGLTFTGYNAANGQTDSALYFARTSGVVTVNISNGAVPSFKSAGATIDMVSSVTVTLTGLKTGSEVRVYDTSAGTLVDGVESSGTSFAFSYTAGENVYIRIFHVDYLPADIEDFTIPGAAASIPIQQVFDRNYRNP